LATRERLALFCGQRALPAAQSGKFLVFLQNRSIYSLLLVLLLQHTTTLKIQASTMDLSSLNVDALLHLIEFVDPVDRFNLAVSGILKGFENVGEGIDLDKRYSETFFPVAM
jgi:hypothetical protein